MHDSSRNSPDIGRLRSELLRRMARPNVTAGTWHAVGDDVALQRTTIGGRDVVVVAFTQPPLTLLSDAELAGVLGLTRRQAAVARRLAARLTSREIAAELAITAATVRNHTETIYLRLGVRGRRELENVLHERILAAVAATR